MVCGDFATHTPTYPTTHLVESAPLQLKLACVCVHVCVCVDVCIMHAWVIHPHASIHTSAHPVDAAI